MLYFIIVWNLLTIACYIIGTWLLSNLKAVSFERVSERFIAAVWLGAIVLSILLLATSLFLPLSPLVGAIIIGCLSISLLLSQQTRSEILTLRSLMSPYLIIGFFIVELGVAALMSQQVVWVDTGLYHYGAIQWLSKFGAVPGLALLNKQFGFVSSWFALAAPLNGEFLNSRVSAVTNGFALLITLLHFIISLAHSFAKNSQLSDWLVVISSLIIIPILTVTNVMSLVLVSPSPDIPVILLTQAIAWSILIAARQEGEKNFILDTQIIPLILSVGAVTIKLNALPLLFVSSLFYFFNRGFSRRRVIVGSALIFVLLSPMFVFGIITSGCPLYPSSALCLNLPWSVTAQEANIMAEVTRGWGIWYGSPPSGVISPLWLFWKWFSSISSNKLITLLILLSFLLAIYVVRTSMSSRGRGQVWLLALAVLGTTFMMLKAPILRFGLGYLVLLPALAIAIFCQKQLSNISPSLEHKLGSLYELISQRQFVLLSSLFLITTSLILAIDNGVQNRLFLPPQLPKVELFQKQINDVVYFLPDNRKGACWAGELPCAYDPSKDITLREPARGIKAGFARKI